MEVKPGYRHTEIGVIPEAWHIARLGDETTRVGSGITPVGGARVYKQEGRPFLRSQNVGWGNLLLDDVAFIDDETHATFRDTEIETDDVLLNITGASIGRSAVADCRVQGGNVNQHVCIIRTLRSGLEPRFLNFFLLSAAGQRQIDSLQAGGNRQGLNFGQVRSLRLPLPALHEQRAIVGALTNAGTPIESLEQLLAKKRQIKQGAMQELLTGKRRLPGFESRRGYKQTDVGVIPGDWEVAKLSTVCSMKSGEGITSAKIDHFSGYPCYGGNGLRGFTKRFTHDGRHVLVGRQGALCGNVLAVEGKFFASEHAIVVTASRGTDTRWLAFVLAEMRLNRYSESSAQPGLSVSKLLSLDLVRPPAKAEQEAIATILSDMAAEIAASETKLAKTRLLKQGMMQDLLTGKIRLSYGHRYSQTAPQGRESDAAQGISPSSAAAHGFVKEQLPD